MKKGIVIFSLFLISILGIKTFVVAHPGDTDTFGCHICYTNCSDYGLFYGQYHCHQELAVTPKSYAGYAPSGSCKNEKRYLFDNESDLQQLELSIYNIKSDVIKRYEGVGATTSKISAIIKKEQSELIQSYNVKYREYTNLYNIYISCLENAGFENYIKMQDSAKKKAQERITNLLQTPNEKCQKSFGSGSIDAGKGYCSCSSGYQFNSTKTSCIAIPKVNKSNTINNTTKTTNTNKIITKNYYKAKNCRAETTTKKDGLCYCKTGYKLSKAGNACVK